MHKEIILESEADAWFLRNKEHLLSKKDFPHLDPLLKYIRPGQEILEVGSSFGYNLNYLTARTQSHGFGLEPSLKAVNFGKSLYKDLQLIHGTIDKADVLQRSFDHVILGFCLYLVDIELLPEVVFRVDKLLKKSGFLHIFDFDTKYPVTREYSHDKRIVVRKMDFSSIFSAFPQYYLAEKHPWSHSDKFFHQEINERCSTMTLYKEM